MEISEINDCSIAKIESTDQFIATNFCSKDTFYEWFYFEITYEKSHVVLILSLKDCFYVGKKESIPSSIYFTWHINNKLVSYSYSIFNDENIKTIQNKIIAFLKGDEGNFEIWLPDFSLNKYIHLNLNMKFLNNKKTLNFNFKNKEHFWQFISNKNSINGSIETIYIPRKKSNKKYASLDHFHDVPLKNRLKNTQVHRIEFNNAHIYLDHNFGFAPLYSIKDNWFWWHTEKNNEWEITYYFPKVKKSFYISSFEPNSINENINPVVSKKINLFLFNYPKKVYSRLFGNIYFHKIIECAPFYLRSKLVDDKITSTMEFLIPKRIANPVNKILMSARQIKINKIIKNELYLESFLSFEDICLKITKNNGKSFFFSSLVMSRYDRLKSYLVYTICRLIDDATDEKQKSLMPSDVGTSFSKVFLDTLWDNNDASITNEFLIELKSKLSFCLSFFIDDKSTVNFIKNARIEIKKLQILKVHFEELILGQLMDENFIQPKNFQEFYLYCFRVAGVIGLMMTKIFGVKDNKKAFESAEHLGIAMQITNILRDIKEDFQMGRIYLPADCCLKNNIFINQDYFSNSELQFIEKINLVQELSDKAIFYYKSSIDGIPYISKLRYRFCVRLMCAIYSGILSKILKNKAIVFKERVVVSRFEKFLILLKVIFGLNPLSAAGIKKY